MTFVEHAILDCLRCFHRVSILNPNLSKTIWQKKPPLAQRSESQTVAEIHNPFVSALNSQCSWSVMKVSELMVRNVITLQTDASVYDAVKLLNKNKIGCLVIVRQDNQIVGILTERDLLERVLEKCRNPKETKVSEIMTRNVISGTPDMDLLEAARIMFKIKVKKLPITDGNRLVGIITLTDIARTTSVDEKTIELVQQLSNLHVFQKCSP